MIRRLVTPLPESAWSLEGRTAVFQELRGAGANDTANQLVDARALIETKR
jgi:hypothetical protein